MHQESIDQFVKLAENAMKDDTPAKPTTSYHDPGAVTSFTYCLTPLSHPTADEEL